MELNKNSKRNETKKAQIRSEYECIEEPLLADGAEDATNNDERRSEIKRLCAPLMLSNDELRHLMNVLLSEMEKGLETKTDSASSLKMLPSYIRSLPNGREEGRFLALDLGGTNFRVLSVTLHGAKTEIVYDTYEISDKITKGTGTQLFDRIAECLAKFLAKHNLGCDVILPLGFTFSFPCLQTDLTSAKLITWTKGFCASGVENEDVAQLLRDACNRRKDINIDVIALLNDTVGTLMSCAFMDNACHVGLIVGTGTNACYIESLSKCPKLEGLRNRSDRDEMIINMEWGALGDNGTLKFLRTEYDAEVNQNSINPGKQLFEKMISGMYLGEIVRVILVHLAKLDLMFDGKFEGLKNPFSFSTKHISKVEMEMEQGIENKYEKTAEILKGFGVEKPTKADCMTVANVCSAVSTRAAFLCAAGLATLINRIDKPNITIGIDGSVYRFHPTFARKLEKKIRELIKPEHNFKLLLSVDGSGRGAAFVAAVATRLRQEAGEHGVPEMLKLHL